MADFFLYFLLGAILAAIASYQYYIFKTLLRINTHLNGIQSNTSEIRVLKEMEMKVKK